MLHSSLRLEPTVTAWLVATCSSRCDPTWDPTCLDTSAVGGSTDFSLEPHHQDWQKEMWNAKKPGKKHGSRNVVWNNHLVSGVPSLVSSLGQMNQALDGRLDLCKYCEVAKHHPSIFTQSSIASLLRGAVLEWNSAAIGVKPSVPQ